MQCLFLRFVSTGFYRASCVGYFVSTNLHWAGIFEGKRGFVPPFCIPFKIICTHSPRFQGENAARNLALAETLRHAADLRGVTVAQAAIAWVLAQGHDIIPVLGARRRDQLAETLGALAVNLAPEDLAAIERAVPKGSAAGTRYAEAQMAHLDSERTHAG